MNDVTAVDALMLACSMAGIGNGCRFMYPELQDGKTTFEEDMPPPDVMRGFAVCPKAEKPNITGRYSVVKNAVRCDGLSPVDGMGFAGLTPSDNPRYAICVFVNKLRGGNSILYSCLVSSTEWWNG